MPRSRVPSFWTAAATHWSQEERAASHVERLGFQFYLPRIRTTRESSVRRSRGEIVQVSELLFPGYLFIRIRRGWESLIHAPGVHRLFVVDESPVRMPDTDVSMLQSLEDDSGFVRLFPEFRKWQTVEVAEGGGAFSGQRGVVEDATLVTRVRVRFASILGRSAVVDFHEGVLRAA